MNRLFLFGLGILMGSLVSCTDKDKIPSGVLPPDKMEKVLWDMIQAEKFTSNFYTRDSTKNVKAENFKLYAQVFAIHNVTKDQFIKSYKFYMGRPDIARGMFDSLTTRANRSREEMYRAKLPQAANGAKTDSSKTRADSSAKAQPPVLKPAPSQPVKPQVTPAQPARPLNDPQLRNRISSLRRIKNDSLLRRKH